MLRILLNVEVNNSGSSEYVGTTPDKPLLVSTVNGIKLSVSQTSKSTVTGVAVSIIFNFSKGGKSSKPFPASIKKFFISFFSSSSNSFHISMKSSGSNGESSLFSNFMKDLEIYFKIMFFLCLI